MTDDKRIKELLPNLLRDMWREAQTTISGTEKSVTAVMNRLAERGSVSQEEAKRVSGDMLRRMRKNREEMARFFDTRLERITDALPMPTQNEVNELRQRIDSLAKRIDRLSNKMN